MRQLIRHRILLAVMIISMFGCCEDDSLLIEGAFEGKFSREGRESIVSLYLIDHQYYGSSDTERFPYIFDGRYIIFKDSIEFINHSPYFANIDGTLVLDGKWGYQINGDSLFLSRFGDQYRLIKQ